MCLLPSPAYAIIRHRFKGKINCISVPSEIRIMQKHDDDDARRKTGWLFKLKSIPKIDTGPVFQVFHLQNLNQCYFLAIVRSKNSVCLYGLYIRFKN